MALFAMQIHCNNLAMTLAARRSEALYDAAFAALGLSAKQYSLLAMISAVGPIEHPALAYAMVLPDRSLRSQLRPLQEAGWIDAADETARKTAMWRLTTGGRRLLTRAERHWKRVQDVVEGELGLQRAATLRQTLGAVAHGNFSGTATLELIANRV